MPIPKEAGQNMNVSVKEMIYEQIRNWIIRGVLIPGEKISDKEIALHFNVSKTPVREAFQMLESQKLIETFPRKATRVSKLRTDNIEEWYLPIIALEELAASLACDKLTDEEIGRLEEMNNKICRYESIDDPLKVMEKDREWHDYIIDVTGNHYIKDMLDTLQIYIQRLEYIFFKSERRRKTKRNASHKDIISAFRNRDSEKAAALMKEHWLQSMYELKEDLGK